jgi:hypothetical protein
MELREESSKLTKHPDLHLAPLLTGLLRDTAAPN